ncbi:hypothetical protein GCM10009675_40250 [Prauserella alba]|uniref:Uncharacterized protein n=1 Tax=Prauserella alba TaxID=176898 RepID=A0ABN1VJK4_9PSEU
MTGLLVCADHLGKAGFEQVDLPSLEPVNPRGVRVDGVDAVAEVGQACCGG